MFYFSLMNSTTVEALSDKNTLVMLCTKPFPQRHTHKPAYSLKFFKSVMLLSFIITYVSLHIFIIPLFLFIFFPFFVCVGDAIGYRLRLCIEIQKNHTVPADGLWLVSFQYQHSMSICWQPWKGGVTCLGGGGEGVWCWRKEGDIKREI